MANEIVNRVANSPIIQIDLEEWYVEGPRITIDLKDWLYEGIMLREKDFRVQISEHDWSQYHDAYISVICSTDAIIPQWAGMLLTSALQPYAKKVVFGTSEMLEALLYEEVFSRLDFSAYHEKPLMIKGCSHKPVPAQAFVSFTERAQPYARNIMYGEACSSVPVYKKQKGD